MGQGRVLTAERHRQGHEVRAVRQRAPGGGDQNLARRADHEDR